VVQRPAFDGASARGRILKTGTFRAILKQRGLTAADLEV